MVSNAGGCTELSLTLWASSCNDEQTCIVTGKRYIQQMTGIRESSLPRANTHRANRYRLRGDKPQTDSTVHYRDHNSRRRIQRQPHPSQAATSKALVSPISITPKSVSLSPSSWRASARRFGGSSMGSFGRKVSATSNDSLVN